MKQLISMAVIALASNMAVSQTNTKDTEAVAGIISTLEKGWNAKSGAIFSSVFAEVHDYIVVNGLYFSNFTRQRNSEIHQSLFDGVYKNQDARLKVDKIQFLRPDLALITAIGARFDKSKPTPEDPSAIMTVLAEKKNNDWKIISFHNHDIDPANKERSPVPMQVMYASWYKK
jgi:uncharacterized protein (TIGR02246 family)